jgi:archaellum component FlaF (FlaF/FlaG flagellin family)
MINHIITKEDNLKYRKELADGRVCMFSCADMGGTDGADDWMITLIDSADKYGSMGLNLYSSQMYDTSLQGILKWFVKIGEQTFNTWGNMHIEEAYADRVNFITPFWRNKDIACKIEIVMLKSGTVRVEINIINNGTKKLNSSIAAFLINNSMEQAKMDNEKTQLNFEKGIAIIKPATPLETIIKPGEEGTFVFYCAAAKEKTKANNNIDKAQNEPIVSWREEQYKMTHPEILNKLPIDDQPFARKVFNDLRLNRIQYKDSCFSAPNRAVHKGQWLWDTCFHLFPTSIFETKLVEKLIENLFTVQQDDGFIPINFNCDEQPVTYATQPPLIPFVLERLTDNSELDKELYPKLKKFCNWLEKNRQIENGLFCWKSGGESGMDNSPRFNENIDETPLLENINYCSSNLTRDKAHIDFSCQMALFYRSMEKIADRIGEDSKEWTEKYNTISKTINDFLYSEEDGFYYDRKLDGTWLKLKTVATFWIFISGVAPEERAKEVLKHIMDEGEFLTPMPLPSVAIDEPSFCLNYWRGPVWMNTVYITILGMREYGFTDEANTIAEMAIGHVKHEWERSGHIWEIYDPFGGPAEKMEKKLFGPRENARLFAGWTACVLNLMFDRIEI